MRAKHATSEYELNKKVGKLVAEIAKLIRSVHSNIENYVTNLRFLVEQTTKPPQFLRKLEANTKVISASIARGVTELQRVVKVEGSNTGTLLHPIMRILAPRVKQLLAQASSQLEKVRGPTCHRSSASVPISECSV